MEELRRVTHQEHDDDHEGRRGKEPVGSIDTLGAAVQYRHPYVHTQRYEYAGTDKSFVIADIPGLIEGAAEGAGLGIQFLKHLSRTRLLLHLVDMAPQDGSDPVQQVRAIEAELAQFDPELLQRPRWLLLNKADILDESERDEYARRIFAALGWTAPGFVISAATRAGTWDVCLAAQRFFDAQRATRVQAETEAADRRFAADDAGAEGA